MNKDNLKNSEWSKANFDFGKGQLEKTLKNMVKTNIENHHESEPMEGVVQSARESQEFDPTMKLV